jgi:hypothetical protein
MRQRRRRLPVLLRPQRANKEDRHPPAFSKVLDTRQRRRRVQACSRPNHSSRFKGPYRFRSVGMLAVGPIFYVDRMGTRPSPRTKSSICQLESLNSLTSRLLDLEIAFLFLVCLFCLFAGRRLLLLFALLFATNVRHTRLKAKGSRGHERRTEAHPRLAPPSAERCAAVVCGTIIVCGTIGSC